MAYTGTKKTSEANPKPSRMREWTVALGLPALVLAVGLGMTGFINYWAGVGLFYGGCAFLLIDWLSLDLPKATKTLGVLFGLAGMAAFSYYAVFRSMPLVVDVKIAGAEYTEGTEAGGITWNPAFGDIRLKITNPTDTDYMNVDATFEVGQDEKTPPQIAQMVQLSGPAVLSFESMDFPEYQPHYQPWTPPKDINLNKTLIRNGDPSLQVMVGTGVTGEPLRFPVISRRNTPSPRYKIRCDRLPAKSTVEVIAAVGIYNPAGSKNALQAFSPPSCMKLSGEYKAGNRPIKITGICHTDSMPPMQ